MNNNITKVNIEEINELTGKLNNISKTVNSNIKSYQKNLDSIEQAGYLKGVAEFAINNSCEKISSICSEFDDYARKLIKELNEVVSKTQQIETEEKGNIEEIISQDPTTFNGTSSSSNAVTSKLSPMMREIIEKMQSHMNTLKGTTGAITGSTITAAGISKALKSSAKEAATKIGTSATANKTQINKTTQENSKTTPAKTEEKKEQTVTSASTPKKTTSAKSGKAMDIPSGSTNYKSYTSYKAVNKSTPQGAVVYGTTSPYGKYAGTTYNTQTDPATGVRYVTFEGDDTKYYCAAMGTYYGEVGDTFRVTTDQGNSYNVIMCDAKGSDAQGRHSSGGTWYHSSGGNKCLTEFYIDKNYIPDAMKVKGGTTGTYNSVKQFSGNINSITKLS